MAKSAVILLVLSAAAHQAFAATLFEGCTKNDECMTRNSECRVLSPSCGRGTCVCIPGHIEALNGSMYACMRNVPLGGMCKAGVDSCATANAECMDGKCKCRPAYQSGPGEAKYTCSVGNQPIGGKCSSKSDCYDFGNLDCMNGKCWCADGYRAFDKFRCVRRYVGDACSNDRDCWGMANQWCWNGRCDCMNGTMKRLVTLPQPISNFEPLYDNVKQGYACFASGSTPSGEGQACFSGDDYLVVSDLIPATLAPKTTTPAPEAPAPTESPVYGEGAAAGPEIFNEGEDYNPGNGGGDGEATEAPAATQPPEKTTLAPLNLPQLSLCAAPFQCTYCTLERPICARMIPMYSSASGVAISAMTFAMAAIVAHVF